LKNKKYFFGISRFFLIQVDKLLNAPRKLLLSAQRLHIGTTEKSGFHIKYMWPTFIPVLMGIDQLIQK